jgi:hypothetical protein
MGRTNALLLLLLAVSCQRSMGTDVRTQTPLPVASGVILPASVPLERDGFGRYTPSPADVEQAEQLIAKQLPSMTASPAYQQEKLPEIVARLSSYVRQYVGLKTPQGQRVLWVSFILSPARHPEWRTGLVTVRGGGHGYFSLMVNLDAGASACQELRINSPR